MQNFIFCFFYAALENVNIQFFNFNIRQYLSVHKQLPNQNFLVIVERVGTDRCKMWQHFFRRMANVTVLLIRNVRKQPGRA